GKSNGRTGEGSPVGEIIVRRSLAERAGHRQQHGCRERTNSSCAHFLGGRVDCPGIKQQPQCQKARATGVNKRRRRLKEQDLASRPKSGGGPGIAEERRFRSYL